MIDHFLKILLESPENLLGHQSRQPRGVELLDLDSGEVVQTFHSIAAACRATGVDWISAWRTCYGIRKESGGYIWRFKENRNGRPDEGKDISVKT
jgi:hypothetical protein